MEARDHPGCVANGWFSLHDYHENLKYLDACKNPAHTPRRNLQSVRSGSRSNLGMAQLCQSQLSAPSPHVPDIEIGQSVVSHSPHSLPSPQRSYSPVVIYPKNAVSPVDSFPSGRFPQLSASPVVSVGQFPQRSVSPLVSSPVVSVGRCQSVGVSRSVSVGVGRCRSVSPVVVSNSFPSGQFPQWTVSPLVSVGQWSVSSVVSFPQRSLLLVRFPRGPFPQWSVSATA